MEYVKYVFNGNLQYKVDAKCGDEFDKSNLHDIAKLNRNHICFLV